MGEPAEVIFGGASSSRDRRPTSQSFWCIFRSVRPAWPASGSGAAARSCVETWRGVLACSAHTSTSPSRGNVEQTTRQNTSEVNAARRGFVTRFMTRFMTASSSPSKGRRRLWLSSGSGSGPFGSRGSSISRTSHMLRTRPQSSSSVSSTPPLRRSVAISRSLARGYRRGAPLFLEAVFGAARAAGVFLCASAQVVKASPLCCCALSHRP